MADGNSNTLETRRAQAFPTLTGAEIDRIRRFASPVRYRSGELVYETGKATPGVLVVLAGTIRITGRDGRGHDIPVTDHGPGSFSGELSALASRPSFVDARAVGEVEALLIDAKRLHDLLMAEAVLGERIMRAMIIRRVAILEAGAGGPVLVGPTSTGGAARLGNFLDRNGIPHQFVDTEHDLEARDFVERYAASPEDLPLAICPDGTVLRNPSESELAHFIGMVDEQSVAGRTFDVAIVGAGPAGLAAAVYAASEGLSVVVIDTRAFGGQAGASARIENYLGFPTGISGQALAGRAFTQAQKFGATILIPAEAVKLDCDAHPFALHLACGGMLTAKTVVVASGARYRRPGYENLDALEGRGVWYWASHIEAKRCAATEVVLVGGGNSAGQAAVYLSDHASKVWMLVRGAGLAASMSRYLIDRIAATGNIELRTRTEITRLGGSKDAGIESVTWKHRDTGAEETRPIRNVFLFLGADPATEWLADCGVQVDARGFVKTGEDPRMPLCSSIPGVFAIGDLRAGSTKRVGAAIGEGAAVVSQIHGFLAQPQSAA
ncbi:MAG TPA: FAD-dependent oxidoreductase [Usitatibacter sp.]|nr:FAD-dependent oxidoreductase [Usitatibacter sp.]